MSLTAAEQYLIELINRARLDPAAEAARYRLDLNAGLSSGQIKQDSLQVLAPNADLAEAADGHSDWMLGNDVFSHTGAGNSSAGDRISDAGYTFTGSWSWRENLAWLGTTGRINLEDAISTHHEGLYRSASHRVNTFSTDAREVGVGQVAGSFTQAGRTYNSSMLTEVFGKTGTDVFVTGVAYADRNGNDFYSMGEGIGGVRIAASGRSETTEAAGGYGLAVAPQDSVKVTLSQGSQTLGHLEVDTSEGNVKLDIVTDRSGGRELNLSGSATLVDGILKASLLGNDDLDLSGRNGNNRLTGNSGDNTMGGGKGHDMIWGGGGNDDLNGHYGNDKLYGQWGSDKLQGGGGNDQLYGGGGNDRLFGGGGSDKLYGSSGNDVLKGGNGKDLLNGGSGRDALLGDNGDDRLLGGGGHDRLYGGSGHDRLEGGTGNDLLQGGGGNDVLIGGSGADTFVYNSGKDRITDFQNNFDTITISGNLADGLSVRDMLDLGSIRNGDAVFDFGNGHRLTIDDVSDLGILANDLNII